MKKLIFLAATVALSASALTAAVTIAANGVKNSASYASPGFPNGAIAQGSLFVVFGAGMGPAQIQYASSFPLPTTLQGTSVSVTVNGTTVQCPMIYTLAGQVAAIMPSTTSVGTGTVVVGYNGTNSSPAPVTVAANSPGLFAVNQQGSGALVATDGNGKPNSSSFSFAPGQTIVLWGTGLGPISGSDASQPTQTNLPGGISVAVNIGGQNAQVVYAGRSQDAGVDQINVVIPSGLSGCYVATYVTVTNANGKSTTSNFGSLAVGASGTACVDPTAPVLSSSGTERVGSVVLTRVNEQFAITGQTYSTISDTGNGVFFAYTPTYLNYVSGTYYDVVSGACTVLMYSNVTATGVTPPTPQYLDAGTVINVNGPNGAKVMTKVTGVPIGFYDVTLGSMTTPSSPFLPPNTPLYLSPGNYTIDNGSGGADVGPFKLAITVPPAFTWTNQSSVTSIDRTQPLKLTWTGGDPNAQVYVVGSSYADSNDFVAFTCTGKDSDGALTVPTSILSLLPPSATLAGGTSGGDLTIESNTSITGSASGLDLLQAVTGFSIMQSVTFK